jgi:acetyl-CoA carboxylase biotin carboxyl carrier protein
MAKKPSKAAAKSSGASTANPDLDILKELVKLLDSSSATEIKFGKGDASYQVSRSPKLFGMPMPDMGAMAPGHAPTHPGQPAAASTPSPASHAPEKPASNLIEIKSPMVGTFYRAPEPGADPYVKSGSRIAAGQTLCIIEAMKIMNEIESEISGTIREVAVEDASPVEFGQVLYRVEP